MSIANVPRAFCIRLVTQTLLTVAEGWLLLDIGWFVLSFIKYFTVCHCRSPALSRGGGGVLGSPVVGLRQLVCNKSCNLCDIFLCINFYTIIFIFGNHESCDTISAWNQIMNITLKFLDFINQKVKHCWCTGVHNSLSFLGDKVAQAFVTVVKIMLITPTKASSNQT